LKKRKDRSWWFFVFCFVFLSFGQVNFLPTSSSSSSAPRRISGSLASTNAFSNSHRVQFGWPDWEAGLEFYGIMLEKRKKKSKISNLIQDLSLHLASQNNVCHFIQRSHRRKQQLEAEAEAGEKWNWHDLQWKWQTNLGFYRLGFLLGEIHHDLRLINSLGKRRKSKSINWKAKQKKKPRQVHWPQNKQPPCHTSQFQHQRAPRRHRWSLLPMNLHHSEALSQKCPQQLHMEGWIWVSPGSFLYSLFSALLSPFIHSAHLSGIAPISLTDSEPALSHSKSPFPQGSAWQIQMSRVRSTKKKNTNKKEPMNPLSPWQRTSSLHTRTEQTWIHTAAFQFQWTPEGGVIDEVHICFPHTLIWFGLDDCSSHKVSPKKKKKKSYTPQMTLVFPSSR